MKDIIVYDESISRFKTNSWVEHIFWRDPEGLADLDSVIARMVTNSEEMCKICINIAYEECATRPRRFSSGWSDMV
jgi:hypothetical protein